MSAVETVPLTIRVDQVIARTKVNPADVTLEHIAADVKAALRECDRAATQGLRWAMEAGKLLEAAKAKLPHGEYERWVLNNCKVTTSMARLYRRLWRRLKDVKPEMISGFRSLEAALAWCREQKAQPIRLAFESVEQRDAFWDALGRHHAKGDPVPAIIRALNAVEPI